MKRRIAGFLATLLLLALAAPTAYALPLTVYLYDPCGGCAKTVAGCGECDLLLEMSNRLGQELRTQVEDEALSIRYRNVDDPAMLELYKEDLAAFGLDNTLETLPAFFVGAPEYGEALLGDQEGEALITAIEAASQKQQVLGLDAEEEIVEEEEPEVVTLPRNDAATDVEEGDSVILYFYKTHCPFCIELKALIHGLPEEITLPDGTSSRVRIIGLNKNIEEELEIVMDYYDLLGIDPERQYVPMLILGDTDLFLYEEIVPELLPTLLSGGAIGTSLEPLLQ